MVALATEACWPDAFAALAPALAPEAAAAAPSKAARPMFDLTADSTARAVLPALAGGRERDQGVRTRSQGKLA
jgi:hypothetical protein